MRSIHSSNHFCSMSGAVNRPVPWRVRWWLLPILYVAVSLSPGSSEPAPVVGVLSYKADGAGADKAEALYASIMAASRNETAFKTIRKNTNTIWYEYDTAE